MQFWAPDDGRKNRLKHVERLTEINKSWNVASCWLYSENVLAMHGPMNVISLTGLFVARNSNKSNLIFHKYISCNIEASGIFVKIRYKSKLEIWFLPCINCTFMKPKYRFSQKFQCHGWPPTFLLHLWLSWTPSTPAFCYLFPSSSYSCDPKLILALPSSIHISFSLFPTQ